MLQHDYFNELLELYPSFGSYLGFNNYNDRYENFISRKLTQKMYKITQKYIKLTNNINDINDIKMKSFKWNLKIQLNGFKNNLWMMPLSSFDNIITNCIFYNKEFYPFNTQNDIDNFLKRHNSFHKIIDSCISSMKEGIKHKMVIPKISCKMIIDDLQNYIDIKEYIIKIPEKFNKHNYDSLTLTFANRLLKLIAFLKNDYIHNCTDTIGLCALPNGKNLYRQLVISQTSLNITPEEVFKYGISEVKRIEEEFKKNRNKMNLSHLDLHSFYKHVQDDSKNYFKNKKELLDNYKFQQKIIENSIMKDKFKYQIRNHNTIKPVPKYQEKSAAAAYYYSGNFTQTRKGTFYINTRNLKENPKYETYVLSLHECSPGHHYQFQYMIENKLDPSNIFAFSNNGFVEGYALYTESLGDYNYLDFFGKLSFEILRAVRLVVDVGIHYYNWSFDKTFTYMKKHIPINHETLKSELIRYIDLPAQALSYKVGEKIFLELQKDFLKKQGNIKNFHEKILENGVIPLEILKNIKLI
jgi:uncharacterized protein (DUF885 family)